MTDSELIVNRIKLLCNEQNIQMGELEEVIGLSKGNISRWKTSLPKNITVLIKMSRYLNSSLDYILCLDKIHSPKESRGVTNSIISTLVSKTKAGSIEWVKIAYEKAKKIPEIGSLNKTQYQSYYETYETSFNGHVIIFSTYSSFSQGIEYNLWLLKYGDDIDIPFTQNEIEQLRMLLLNKKSQALSELLQDLNG